MDREIEAKLVQGYKLTTLQIYYYMPDYSSLINEFVYQLLDINPSYPQSHKFLLFWKDNIDAIIKEINIVQENTIYPRSITHVTHLGMLNRYIN